MYLGAASPLPLFGRAIALYVAYRLADLGQGIFHVVFVFDGDVAFESLLLKLFQNTGNVGYSGSGRNVVALGREDVEILQVAANHTALEDFNAIDRLQSRPDPVPRIGAGTYSFVPILDHRQNVVGIPHFVIGVIRLLGVVMKADHNVIFLDQLFNNVYGANRFRGDCAQIQRL